MSVISGSDRPVYRSKLGDEYHDYLSTACLHGEHDYCSTATTRPDGTAKVPAQCKFCKAPCRCPCHAVAADDQPPHS